MYMIGPIISKVDETYLICSCVSKAEMRIVSKEACQ